MADFLAIILALITIYPIVKAMKIKERLSPLITLWRKEGKVSRVIISLILIATIGIGSNKDFLPGVLTNGVPPKVSLPTNGVQQTQLMGMVRLRSFGAIAVRSTNLAKKRIAGVHLLIDEVYEINKYDS